MINFNCCRDLQEAMTSPDNSFFRIEENGVLFLTIGYTQTEQGTGWFDQAILYCPFCGKTLQTRDEIALKSQAIQTDERIN
jgi:hypothetical protein